MRFFKVSVLIAAAIFILGSCRSTRSSRKIQQAISKPKDTTAIVIVHKDEQPDSLVKLHAALLGMYGHHIDYITFSAKVKVDYSGENGRLNFIANIRMKKDSVIWIDLSGLFGLFGMRALITPDTVRIINETKHTYQKRSLSYLQDLVKIPFDFKTIQDLLVGNPIFFDSARVISYRPGSGSTFLLSTGDFFKNLVTLTNGDDLIMHSKLDDVDPTRSRTADLTFDNYVNKGDISFATTRSIGISEKTQVDIELNFKQFEFNVPLSYPFNIPKKYSRIK